MLSTVLPGTDITLSRMTFGTGTSHHLTSAHDRLNLLAAAADHGFTHFDTAPFYGYGLAELELGAFLKSRKNLTITTKFGLYPPAGSAPHIPSVWSFKLMGKISPPISKPIVDWSLTAAKKSLELSLKRLGRDHVDFLMLHEPSALIANPDEVLEWLREEKQKGKIRAWGLAGPADDMSHLISENHPLGMVFQVRDSLEKPEADALLSQKRDLQFTYGYLSHTNRPAVETLRLALKRNTKGSILVSTRKVERLAQLVKAFENS